jgi:hypothetical protein
MWGFVWNGFYPRGPCFDSFVCLFCLCGNSRIFAWNKCVAFLAVHFLQSARSRVHMCVRVCVLHCASLHLGEPLAWSRSTTSMSRRCTQTHTTRTYSCMSSPDNAAAATSYGCGGDWGAFFCLEACVRSSSVVPRLSWCLVLLA